MSAEVLCEGSKEGGPDAAGLELLRQIDSAELCVVVCEWLADWAAGDETCELAVEQSDEHTSVRGDMVIPHGGAGCVIECG